MPVIQFGGGGLLPEDVYTVFAYDAKFGSSSGGFPQITVDFQILGGDYNGRTVRGWLINGNGMTQLDELLAACGVERGDDGNWHLSDDFNEVNGVLLQVALEDNEWEGRVNSRPVAFLPNDPIGQRYEDFGTEDDDF